ncbi:hypothetical protein ACP275_10G186800 [Erythranthe tilingii]
MDNMIPTPHYRSSSSIQKTLNLSRRKLIKEIIIMCPLRFILVFFSAILAGYFAWKTAVSSSDDDITTGTGVIDDSTALHTTSSEKQQFHILKMIHNGFWVFIDMASGRYLWRNIKQFNSSRHMTLAS